MNVCLVAAIPRPTSFPSVFIDFGFSINAKIDASLKNFGAFVFFGTMVIVFRLRLSQSISDKTCESKIFSFSSGVLIVTKVFH